MRGKFFILYLLIIFPVSSSLAQWTKLNSPEIIVPLSTYAVASKGDTLFVGTYRSTIYRSFDNGLNWARSDSGISFIYWTYDFLITQNTVFAMGEEGIFRSTDWGDSWQQKNNGLHTANWMNVYAMVKLNNLLFAATDFGVYSSSDNGDSWTPATGDSSYSPILSLTVLNGILFESRLGGGVYFSSDNGSTWKSASNGLPQNLKNYDRINKLFVDGNNIYAGLNDYGIYRSTNNGMLWQPDTAGLKRMNYGYLNPVYSFAKIGNYIYAGTEDGGIYRKNNSENNWDAINQGLPANSYVTSIVQNKDKIFAASHTGLYNSSINNINWSPLFTEYPGIVNTGFIASCGNSIFLRAASDYYNGQKIGVFSTSNTGGSWFNDTALTKNRTYSIQSFGDSLYALGNYLMFSSDCGNSWEKIDSGLTYVTALIKNNDTLFTGHGFYSWQWGEFGEVYLSANNGRTWNKIWSADTTITAITKIGNNVILGSLHGVFRSRDLGKSWIAINNGLPSNISIVCFTYSGNNIFAGTSKGIYLTTNYGDSWSEADNGIPANTFYYSKFNMIVNNNEIFAGTKNGVFVTKDMGNNWISVNDGLSGNAIIINSLTTNGNNIFISTNDGVWKRTLTEIVSVENSKDNLPKDFLLYQNYPNPFNPKTEIEFRIPEHGFVSLKVYDVLGREVSTLVNEFKPAGNYRVTFDASNLPSGMYIYQMRVNNFIAAKKLLVLK